MKGAHALSRQESSRAGARGCGVVQSSGLSAGWSSGRARPVGLRAEGLRAGVRGRVTELARVSHARYNLALAVVLGRDLDGVVCDTKATAQECIAWLRANQVAPIQFFPLDTVRPKARPEL